MRMADGLKDNLNKHSSPTHITLNDAFKANVVHILIHKISVAPIKVLPPMK